MPSETEAGSPAPAGRFYLPELDILRFFAFFWMFLVHAVIAFPAFDSSAQPRLVNAGFYTVDLFFALSAYLLTQLMLREVARRGKVDVRAFYLRRILRIWPLYFFFLALAFLLSTGFRNSRYAMGFTASSAYFTTFLIFIGNFTICHLGPPVVVISPLWTISAEEQIYLVLPWLVRKARPWWAALVGLGLMATANYVRYYFAYHFTSGVPVWFNTFAHLDSIGIGVLLAAMPRGWFAAIPRAGRLALVAIGIGCWLTAVNYYNAEIAADTPYQVIFSYALGALGSGAIMAGFIGASKGTITSGPGRALVYLGKISYGLYVYHGLGLTLTNWFLSPLPARSVTDHLAVALSKQMVNITISFFVTLAIAACSYEWLESSFLRFKERFTVVASRPV
jgi:peptidoglycan/LPS O-acetylase OafA/YrhL